MPEDLDYMPCANCGDEWSETLENSGQPLCEACYNVWRCGCGKGCESCTEAEDGKGYGARSCPAEGCAAILAYPDEVDCGEHVAGVAAR